MDSEKDIESATKFLYVNKLFKSANINCPTIHGFSDDLSYILLEDLGKEVLDICEISNLDTFFKNILMELKKIYLLPTETLPKISNNELLSQTESFLNVFIYKDKKIDEKESQICKLCEDILCMHYLYNHKFRHTQILNEEI